MNKQLGRRSLRRLINLVCVRMSTELNKPFYSPEASDLLLMIAAHESKLGKFRRQVGGGPALGIFQVERDTLSDLYDNYLAFRPPYLKTVDLYIPAKWDRLEALENYDTYAIAVSRMLLWRIKEPIPKESHFAADPEPRTSYLLALADYAKKYWNTPEGEATPEKYLRDFLRTA